GEVGIAAEQPRDLRREMVERLARRLARREAGARRERRQVLVPAGRELAGHHRLPLGGLGREGLLIGGEAALPVAARRLAALGAALELGARLVGDDEALRRIEAERLLGRRELLLAERAAVRLRRPGLLRRAV